MIDLDVGSYMYLHVRIDKCRVINIEVVMNYERGSD